MSASIAVQRISRRRHRSLRTAPHRRLARRHHRPRPRRRRRAASSGTRTVPPASAPRRASQASRPMRRSRAPIRDLRQRPAGLRRRRSGNLATIGGNLAQRSRCWYFRNPHFSCYKKGGSDCPSRAGNHLYGVAFDLGPCVAPHPSTLAAALLAYDATVTTDKRSGAFDRRRARRRLACGQRSHARRGRDRQEHPAAAAACRRACVLQACDQQDLCRVASGGSRRARDGVGRQVRCRARDGGRHRAGAAASGRGRARGDWCCWRRQRRRRPPRRMRSPVQSRCR